ncbi:MAG: hypothetical protein K8H87_03715 [Pseudorhodoplanes sp.]|nr:hypothetical protein [Pseudorhodoplanes sp.]
MPVFLPIVAVTGLAFALLPAPAGAQEGVGQRLEAAGFRMRAANTAERMARLRSLPARKFVARLNDGTRYYVYADPDYCRCAYVGSQKALDDFRSARAGAGFLPGYRGPADTSQPSGADVEIEMIHDMAQDGGPVPGDDIFHPGF